jgi:hypothetical protein
LLPTIQDLHPAGNAREAHRIFAMSIIRKCRISEHRARYMASLESEFRARFEPASYDILSVDIFDTLLLRDTRCERRRFLHVADALSRALAKAAINIPSSAIFATRLLVHSLGYRALRARGSSGDRKIEDFVRVQLDVLGLPAEWRSRFLDIEIQCERASLRLNTELVAFLDLTRAA